MKKICGMAIIAIIICIGWSLPSVSAETIEILGTIEYMKSLPVDIDSEEELDLVFIASSMDESDITIINYGFDPVVNKTRFLFRSEYIDAEYWMKSESVPYIYQENVTKQLYCIYVNYTSLEVPEDPWEIKYLNMSSEYNRTYQELSITIYNLTRTKLELDELVITYIDTSQELNITLAQKENLTNLLINKSSEINALENDLNESENALMIMTNDATVFRRFFDEMTSYKSNFNFKIAGRTEEFTTIYEYEDKIGQLEDQVSGFPILIFFFVAITMIVCLMIGYWKWAKKRSSPEEVEILDGVDPITTGVNRFKSRLRIKPKHVKIKEKEALTEENKTAQATVVADKEKELDINRKYEDMKYDIDNKIKNIESRISTNHETIMERLSEMLAPAKKPGRPVKK